MSVAGAHEALHLPMLVSGRGATPSRRAGYPLDATVCATEARGAVARTVRDPGDRAVAIAQH
jgi:hypothetical protein